MYWREVVASLYPLDLLDEGLNQILMNLLWHSSVTSTALLAEIPELYAFLKFRADSLTAFFREICQAVLASSPLLTFA